ncbi:sialate O-acetylesterase [Sorangium sp. So ce448]|uniref:sialate O-acetylesterase n=1 Tax=Sorangium sp. So ce448 TaxID=3133314 RepID=UPI003F60A0E8
MKPLLNVSLSRSRWALVSLFALVGGLACGVAEHPHDTQSVGAGDDFGPSSGAGGATTTGGASVGGAMTAASGSGGGSSGTGDAGAGGGPAPSGVTINLGGVDVPRERAIAFIHIGHSNMAGRATRPQSSRPYHFTETHPHAFMYHPGSAPELAIEPKTAGDTAAGGPGTALVKEAAMLAPDNYFISLGFGWPSAYCSQFIPGGLYYDKLIAAPKAIKGRVTFGGIFIYLGITERHGTAADRTGFPDCINTLVTAIRNDVGEPTLPALMNDYEVEGSGEFAVGGAVATAIRPEIERCPSVVSNFALVSAEGVGMQDDHHFNLDGHRTWVQRALATMKDKGWRPWAP